MFDEGILNIGLIDNTVNDCENETEKRHRDFFLLFHFATKSRWRTRSLINHSKFSDRSILKVPR